MKLDLALIVLLIVATFAQHRSQYQGNQYQRRHPQDAHSIGMSYQAPPPPPPAEAQAQSEDDVTNAFIQSFISMFLEQMRTIHIDRYETEDGAFTNVDIAVRPPSPKDITFKADSSTDSILFMLHGVSINIDTDLDMYSGTIKGHGTFKIDNIDVDLKTMPQTINGVETVNIQYHLHLKDADIKADIQAQEDTSFLPAELQEGFLPFQDMFGTNFKIAAADMVDKTFEKHTQDVVQSYLDSMNSNYRIPKRLDHNVSFIFILNLENGRYYC